MKILFIGDVIGPPGCRFLREHLQTLKRQCPGCVVVANGENSAQGNGITKESCEDLFTSGVDAVTTGNHVFKWRDFHDYLDHAPFVVRPLNFHPSCPGKGVCVLDFGRTSLAVINLAGQAYLDPCDNPFDAADRVLPEIGAKNILVDFHAEASGEKGALAHYLDGRVSAVVGTHTHVQTADEKILKGGTGFITDAGMVGGRYSVLGVKAPLVIDRMRKKMPVRFDVDPEDISMDAVWIETDDDTGKCINIERINIF